MRKKWIYIIPAISLLFVISAFYWYFDFLLSNFEYDFGVGCLTPNEFGDAFGAITAAMTAVVLIISISSIVIQSSELKLSRVEFETNRALTIIAKQYELTSLNRVNNSAFDVIHAYVEGIDENFKDATLIGVELKNNKKGFLRSHGQFSPIQFLNGQLYDCEIQVNEYYKFLSLADSLMSKSSANVSDELLVFVNTNCTVNMIRCCMVINRVYSKFSSLFEMMDDTPIQSFKKMAYMGNFFEEYKARLDVLANNRFNSRLIERK